MTRFSDEELHRFREEFDDHVKEEESYRDHNDMLMNEVLSATRENTEAIKALEQSTSGVVGLFKEGQIGKLWMVRAGKIVLWLAGIYAAVKLLIEK